MMKKGLFSVFKRSGVFLAGVLIAAGIAGCGKKADDETKTPELVLPADKKVTVRTADGAYREVYVVVAEDGALLYKDPVSGEVIELYGQEEKPGWQAGRAIGSGFMAVKEAPEPQETVMTDEETKPGSESIGTEPVKGVVDTDRQYDLPEDLPDESVSGPIQPDIKEEQPPDADIQTPFRLADYTGIRVHSTAAYGNAADAYAFINAHCTRDMTETEIVRILYLAVASADDSRANAKLHNLCNYAGIECHQCVAVYEDGLDSGYQPLLITADGRTGYYAPYENLHGGFNGNVYNSNKEELLNYLNEKNAAFIEAGIDGYLTDVRIARGM